MTATLFNRIQTLKEYKPMEPIQFLPKQVNEFVKKMQAIVILEGCDPPIPYLLELEGMKEVVDADYVKYLARKHIVNILEYIDGKGVVLEDIEWNISQILKEIINGTVDEDYYTNTIDIYDSINGSHTDDIDLYDVINQAIRLDNKRLLYYIIFKESEDIIDRAFEVIRENP